MGSFGITPLSIKTKAARNKFPRNELTPKTEDCECKSYSLEVKVGKIGCALPRSMAHKLTNTAELFRERFFQASLGNAKTQYFYFFLYSVMEVLWFTYRSAVS